MPSTRKLRVWRAVDAILAGAAWDRLLVLLPARSTIGAVAYAHYACATDLSNGLILYPLLGIGGPLITWITFAVALRTGASTQIKIAISVAAASAVLMLLMTSQAAPIMMSVGPAADQANVLMPLLDRFAAWSVARGVFLNLTFWSMLWALAVRRQGTHEASSAEKKLTVKEVSAQ